MEYWREGAGAGYGIEKNASLHLKRTFERHTASLSVSVFGTFSVHRSHAGITGSTTARRSESVQNTKHKQARSDIGTK